MVTIPYEGYPELRSYHPTLYCYTLVQKEVIAFICANSDDVTTVGTHPLLLSRSCSLNELRPSSATLIANHNVSSADERFHLYDRIVTHVSSWFSVNKLVMSE